MPVIAPPTGLPRSPTYRGSTKLVRLDGGPNGTVIVAGAADPVGAQPGGRRSLGWLQPPARHPVESTWSGSAWRRAPLSRRVTAEGHAYSWPGSEDAELVLGRLSGRPLWGDVPLFPLLRGGAIVGLARADAERPLPPTRAQAVRWALAPLRWRRWRTARARVELVRWRSARVAPLVRGECVPERGRDPVVWAWPEHAPGRLPLLAATHPVTGDCVLTLHEAEPGSWGYGLPIRLGWVDAASPNRWGDFSRERPWCWHAGRDVRV